MKTQTDAARFAAACQKAAADSGEGIGSLGEKSTHRALKYYFLPDEACHEQPLLGYIADGLGEDGVIEVQSRNLYTLLPKLTAFLTQVPVTVVYPAVVRAQIHWLDPQTGEEAAVGKTGRRGGVYQVLPQLYGLRSLLPKPGLRVVSVAVEQSQLRLLDGYGKEKKHRATKLDNLPIAAGEMLWLENREDYAACLPASLPEEFTAQELAGALCLPKRDSSRTVGVFAAWGLLEPTGAQRGRARLWRRAE